MCYKTSMKTDPLSRRERELMDILFRLGEGTVSQARAEMTSPPSYSAVRALMNTLVDKGQLSHRQQGRAYVYTPVQPREEAAVSALRRVVSAFFGGSPAQAAVALVGLEELGAEELAALREAVERAEEEGR